MVVGEGDEHLVQRIQLRRGTAVEWAAANPTLADGEKGLEQDTGQEKTGDGVTPWNELPYASFDGGSP